MRVVAALLGLLAVQSAIQAGKARRLEKARNYYQRTKNLEQTLKTYNVTQEELNNEKSHFN